MTAAEIPAAGIAPDPKSRPQAVSSRTETTVTETVTYVATCPGCWTRFTEPELVDAVRAATGCCGQGAVG